MITNYFVKGGTWNLYVDKVDSYATVNVGFSHNDIICECYKNSTYNIWIGGSR